MLKEVVKRIAIFSGDLSRISRYSPVVETLPNMLWDITSSLILELTYGFLLLFPSLNIVT